MPDVERFKNRAQAGKRLAQQLGAYAHQHEVVVLALPRGGVPVGFAVAMTLGVDLDVLLVHKLGAPGQAEYAIGAVGSGGVLVTQPGASDMMGVAPAVVAAIAQREVAELDRRERLYRGGRPPLSLKGRTAILVDDGIATGATMLAAVQVARKQGAARIVAAVPVAPPDTVDELAPHVDQLVCLSTPQLFRAVSQWYCEFDQTTDEEVQDLLAIAWRDQDRRLAASLTKPTGRTES
jgi:putative phosphoribosyl transferase